MSLPLLQRCSLGRLGALWRVLRRHRRVVRDARWCRALWLRAAEASTRESLGFAFSASGRHART
eukprot:6211319-Pleurochrysis_carterae.AAC.1